MKSKDRRLIGSIELNDDHHWLRVSHNEKFDSCDDDAILYLQIKRDGWVFKLGFAAILGEIIPVNPSL